jgi:hypothetical protein
MITAALEAHPYSKLAAPLLWSNKRTGILPDLLLSTASKPALVF